MATVDELKVELEELYEELALAKQARKTAVARGTAEYTIKNGDDDRSVVFYTLEQLNDHIAELRKEIMSLETKIQVGGKLPHGFIVGVRL